MVDTADTAAGMVDTVVMECMTTMAVDTAATAVDTVDTADTADTEVTAVDTADMEGTVVGASLCFPLLVFFSCFAPLFLPVPCLVLPEILHLLYASTLSHSE